MTRPSRTALVAPVTAPDLPTDLTAGLRWLKLAAVRRIAPELLITARTQRWTPEDLLRTLIGAEITPGTPRTRRPGSRPPRSRAQDHRRVRRRRIIDLAGHVRPPDRLEWLCSKANLALVGPPDTGKSHTPIALGHAAVTGGYRVNTAPQQISSRPSTAGWPTTPSARSSTRCSANDLVIQNEVEFAPLGDTGTQLLFRLVAAAYERRSLAAASHWASDQWGNSCPNTPPPSASWTGSCNTTVVIFGGESYRMCDARHHRKEHTTTRNT